MNSEAETQIPLLPIYTNTENLAENANIMGATMRQRPTGLKLTDLTVNIPSSNRQPLTANKLAPSRWATLEFKVYFVVALLVVPIMVWIPVSVSSGMSY